MSQPVLIAVAVVEHDGQFLVGRRAAGVPLAGFWEFPGGKVHPGESPADAAIRECREETGLNVDVVGEFPRNVERYDHGCVELHFFDCRLGGGPPTPPLPPRPRSPFCWTPRAALRELQFPAGNRHLIDWLVPSP